MSRQADIHRELHRLGRVASGIQERYTAYFSLHRAAAANQDKQEMAQRREDLHTVLDAMLDNGEAIAHLAHELETLL